MKKIISLIIFCLIITGCKSAYTLIDSNKAMDLINNENAIVIDVRENNEYVSEHIENAINIPLSQIETIDLDKTTPIIVYCATGIRSLDAVKKLSNLGYENLYNLDGGLLNWGFETVK